MRKRGRKRITSTGHRTAFLKTVERTIDVLEILGKENSLPLVDIAEKMDTSVSTAHRILHTLAKRDFIIQDIKTDRYALGHKIYKLIRSTTETITLFDYIQPYLNELCKLTGETVLFSILNKEKTKVITISEKAPQERIVVAKGVLFRELPLTATATGKAYLMTLDKENLEKTVAKTGFVIETKFSVRDIKNLKKQLKEFNEAGCAMVNSEYSVGVDAIAVPVFDDTGNFIGIVTLLWPSERVNKVTAKAYRKILIEKGKQISLGLRTKNVI
jgi:DNA-binding IclR family transcriptional regulator